MSMRAHDVRKLKICAYCNGFGMRDQMIVEDDGRYSHPICLVRAQGERYVLLLPLAELRKMTADSLSKRGMRRALDRLAQCEAVLLRSGRQCRNRKVRDRSTCYRHIWTEAVPGSQWMRPIATAARLFTGYPIARGYIRDTESGTVVWACPHRHRSRRLPGYGPDGLRRRKSAVAYAQECADRALKRRAWERPAPTPVRPFSETR